MNIKQTIAVAAIIVVSLLTLFFGVRFINAVFNDVEKKQTTAVDTTRAYDPKWSCVETMADGEKVYYEGMAFCHDRAAKGGKVVTIWGNRK